MNANKNKQTKKKNFVLGSQVKTFELNEEKTTHINFLMETLQTPLSPDFIPITVSTQSKQNKTHTYIPITV